MHDQEQRPDIGDNEGLPSSQTSCCVTSARRGTNNDPCGPPKRRWDKKTPLRTGSAKRGTTGVDDVQAGYERARRTPGSTPNEQPTTDETPTAERSDDLLG